MSLQSSVYRLQLRCFITLSANSEATENGKQKTEDCKDMATIHRFEDLTAWKKARHLAKAVFDVTKQQPFASDYDLVRQIRRASGSVMDNIAEGFGRGGRGEFIQFLSIAKGSVIEVKSQVYRALDYQYITKEVQQELYDQADETAKIMDGLLTYLKNSGLKGRKYVNETEAPYQTLPKQTEDCEL